MRKRREGNRVHLGKHGGHAICGLPIHGNMVSIDPNAPNAWEHTTCKECLNQINNQHAIDVFYAWYNAKLRKGL